MSIAIVVGFNKSLQGKCLKKLDIDSPSFYVYTQTHK